MKTLVWRLPLFLLALPAVPALAESPTWSGSLGAGVIGAPDYLGSDDYKAHPLPMVELRYGDVYFSVRDGLGWNALRGDGWALSPFLGYTFGRDNEGDIERFESVDGGLTFGTRLTYMHQQWIYAFSVETPLTGDMDGVEARASATWMHRPQERWLVTLSPNLSYSSKEWTQSLFEVSEADSARSGIEAYEPDSGYFRFGLVATLSYHLTPNWSVGTIGGLSYLTGDAADSPIVDDHGDELQAILGATLNYRF